MDAAVESTSLSPSASGYPGGSGWYKCLERGEFMWDVAPLTDVSGVGYDRSTMHSAAPLPVTALSVGNALGGGVELLAGLGAPVEILPCQQAKLSTAVSARHRRRIWWYSMIHEEDPPRARSRRGCPPLSLFIRAPMPAQRLRPFRIGN